MLSVAIEATDIPVMVKATVTLLLNKYALIVMNLLKTKKFQIV